MEIRIPLKGYYLDSRDKSYYWDILEGLDPNMIYTASIEPELKPDRYDDMCDEEKEDYPYPFATDLVFKPLMENGQ